MHFVDTVEDVQVTDPLRDIWLRDVLFTEDNSTSRKVLILTSDYYPEANLVGIGLRN